MMMLSKIEIDRFLYPANLKEALHLQKVLASQIIIRALPQEPACIAAADASFLPNRVLAAACLFSFPELQLIEAATAEAPLRFPYRTGFLSFCEGPAVFQALNSLKKKPDLLLLDGQGIAHPRRLGLATFLGLLFELPSIGCAKSLLVGTFEPPPARAGAFSELRQKGEWLGYVLRSRDRVKPIFISPGHLIDHSTSLKIIISCLRGYRIPEPLRQAHHLTIKLKELRK